MKLQLDWLIQQIRNGNSTSVVLAMLFGGKASSAQTQTLDMFPTEGNALPPQKDGNSKKETPFMKGRGHR